MVVYEIIGGKPLYGTITPKGAKNEAMQVISATLLTDEKVILRNIPKIIDVMHLLDLLKCIGVEIEELEESVYSFCASSLNSGYFEKPEFIEKSKKIRGAIMFMSPLLARLGEAYFYKPGGDKIGRRQIDTHLLGLQDLGVNFEYLHDKRLFHTYTKKLKGTYVLLKEASVTGTANIVMAAVLAEGTTTIYNAACEPYIQQLCKMLTHMGAKITGIGSNLLHIEGVSSLKGTDHTLLSDMIEIGSFMGMAALTKSEITIKNSNYNQLGLIPYVFQSMGVHFEHRSDDSIFIPAQEEYEISTFIDGSMLTIADAPWPGFTPDLISIILVLASQAKGSVLVHQKMFESRLFFVDKLIEMGAKIILCDPHRACVIGHNRAISLKGIEMISPDIRAGVAMLLAALSAKGKSTIYNVEQIERGYQNIDERLKLLGAEIYRRD